MNQILTFGYSVCVSLILFGFASFLGHDSKYRALIKMICGLLFAMIVVNGINGLNTDINDIKNLFLTDINEGVADPNEESLQYQIKSYINRELSQNGFSGALCSAVTVEKKQQSYQIKSIYLTFSGGDTDKLILYITKLTGVRKEHIFVE